MKQSFFVLCVMLSAGGPAFAGGHHNCCADCGCTTGLRKVCRWECEEIEVTEPGWDCECEDIVIPGKSPFCIQPDCNHCDGCENGCRACRRHLGGHLHHKKIWGPPCDCCVKSVKFLVPTEKKVTKKVWKPVIETVCGACCAAGGCAGGPPPVGSMPAGAPTLAPPPADTAALVPPMPEASTGRPRARGGIGSFLSAFAPAGQAR